MKSSVKNELLNIKNMFNMLGFELLDYNDKRNINNMLSRIGKIKVRAQVANDVVCLDEVLENSLKYFDMFGSDIKDRIVSITDSISYVPFFEKSSEFTCAISYSKGLDGKLNPGTGVVDHYKVPVFFSPISSICLAHEHIHALKETNYKEYKYSQVLGDVLPILYELIITKDDIKLRKDLIIVWFNLISEYKIVYNRAKDMASKHFNDKDLFKIQLTQVGQYLNSFYYALILYNKYESNPDMIISLMEMVLRGELITIEMLNLLNLYPKGDIDTFGLEFDNMKKVLK